jgi:hypothetical protein
VYATEPYYQVGPIEQAITDVVRTDNRLYFSLAHNWADDGFESPFRAATGTVGGNTGTFMDFNPGAGVDIDFPLFVNTPGLFVFQYDQPFFGVTSDIDVFIVDGAGTIVAQGNSNNLATQRPEELFAIPNAGNFTVSVFVRSGPAPGRVYLRSFSPAQSGGMTFDTALYGNAGGITYATVLGHNGGLDAITVGAVPFFNAPPFGSQSPLRNEDFSSFGPRRLIFDSSGLRLPGGMQTLQRPSVSAIDAANTTFFGTDILQDTDTLPNFFGTSAATPNLGALAALMRELSPGVNQDDVLQALISSAVPLNGAARGAWDPQGGFGLVQAVASLQSVDQLRVTTTTPADGATLSTSVSQITVNFNKTLNASTIQASDLVFTQTPPGISVVATSVQVTGPTSAVFTLRTTRTGTAKANGNYVYTLAAGSIAAADGKLLAAFVGNFSVQDTISPRILGTDFSDRRAIIQFSEPMDPNTVNGNSIQLIRAGNDDQFGTPDDVVLNGLPGFAVTYFNNFGSLSNVAVVDI